MWWSEQRPQTLGRTPRRLSPNTAELPVVLLAAQAAGIATPVNPDLAPEHIEQLLRRGGARVLKPALRLDAARRAVHAEPTALGAGYTLDQIDGRALDGGVLIVLPEPPDEALRRRIAAALDRYALTWRYACQPPSEPVPDRSAHR